MNDKGVFALYAKGLLKENSLAKAIDAYKKALTIDPHYYDDELDSHLRYKSIPDDNIQENDIDHRS